MKCLLHQVLPDEARLAQLGSGLDQSEKNLRSEPKNFKLIVAQRQSEFTIQIHFIIEMKIGKSVVCNIAR